MPGLKKSGGRCNNLVRRTPKKTDHWYNGNLEFIHLIFPKSQQIILFS